MYEHVKDVQEGRIPNGSNTKLENKIKKILSLAQKIKYKKIFITKDEKDAYNKEKEIIKEIGLENLCNLTHGGEGGIATEEIKRKISENKKGIIFSENYKRKLSESHKGLKYSEMSKKKMSKLKKGHKVSAETRQKLAEANKDQIPWIKGKVHTEESKRKISKSKKGHKISIETRRKISLSLKGRKKE